MPSSWDPWEELAEKDWGAQFLFRRMIGRNPKDAETRWSNGWFIASLYRKKRSKQRGEDVNRGVDTWPPMWASLGVRSQGRSCAFRIRRPAVVLHVGSSWLGVASARSQGNGEISTPLQDLIKDVQIPPPFPTHPLPNNRGKQTLLYSHPLPPPLVPSLRPPDRRPEHRLTKSQLRFAGPHGSAGAMTNWLPRFLDQLRTPRPGRQDKEWPSIWRLGPALPTSFFTPTTPPRPPPHLQAPSLFGSSRSLMLFWLDPPQPQRVSREEGSDRVVWQNVCFAR